MRNNFTRRTSCAFMAVSVFMGSCSKKPAQNVFPVGSPMAPSIHFQYAVYMLPVHLKDPSAVLRDALVKHSAGLKLLGEIPPEPREMIVSAHLQKHVQQEHVPPSIEAISYSGHGISPPQAQALQKSGEAFSPDAWHETRLKSWTDDVPDISSQTVVQTYKKDELVRAITLGMTKVGLPDVVMDDFPWSSEHQVVDLINLFCQTMTEGAVLAKSGEFDLDIRAIQNSHVRDTRLKSMKGNFLGVTYLSLKLGVWENGDPKNRLIQLSSDRYAGKDVPAKQDRMLNCFFGWEDKASIIQHNDELLEESRKERAKLPGLQRDFDSGLQAGEYILVKAPFKTPGGGNEWMWVEITSWKGNLIRGTLQNEPFNIPELHGGQIVEIWQTEVFDYIRQYPDKRKEGNTTSEIIRKQQENPGSSTQVSPQ